MIIPKEKSEWTWKATIPEGGHAMWKIFSRAYLCEFLLLREGKRSAIGPIPIGIWLNSHKLKVSAFIVLHADDWQLTSRSNHPGYEIITIFVFYQAFLECGTKNIHCCKIIDGMQIAILSDVFQVTTCYDFIPEPGYCHACTFPITFKNFSTPSNFPPADGFNFGKA